MGPAVVEDLSMAAWAVGGHRGAALVARYKMWVQVYVCIYVYKKQFILNGDTISHRRRCLNPAMVSI